MAWLSGYNYRAKIPVSATSAGAQTNYQKQIAIAQGSGSNIAGTIYLNNHALNWPYDIRFTKADGETLLDFYREEYDSTDGTWHVEIDSIAASGDTDLYVYYGKSSDSDASNGDNTFIFFDDFESGNFSKWYYAGSAWSVQSSVVHSGSYSAKGQYNTTFENRILEKNFSYSLGSILIRSYVRFSALGGSCFPIVVATEDNAILYPLIMNWGDFDFADGEWKYLPTRTTINADQWYLAEVALDRESGLFRWWIDSDSKGTSALKDTSGNTIDTSDYFIWLINITSADSTDINEFIDKVWVRKYIYPEPQWTSPSSEEEFSSTTIPIFMNQYKQRWS